jgi:cholesterol transport system auxiliary component
MNAFKPLPSRRGFATGLALLLSGLPLASCSSLVPSIGTPPRLYTLSPKNTFREDLQRSFYQLVIEEPVATQGIDSDRITLHKGPSEISFYAGARWVERAPRLVQTLIVESFENSNRVEAVSRQAIGLRADFTIKSELREFQAEYADGLGIPPVIRVRLNIKLVRESDSRIVASRSVEATAPAERDEISAVLVAFDEALGKVLRRTIEWSVEALLGQAEDGVPASIGRPRRLSSSGLGTATK